MSLASLAKMYGLFRSTSRTKRRPSVPSTPRLKPSVDSTSLLTMPGMATFREGRPEYDATVGATVRFQRNYDGKQPGDPAKAAAAVLHIASLADPPLRLLLGSDASKLPRNTLSKFMRPTESGRISAFRRIRSFATSRLMLTSGDLLNLNLRRLYPIDVSGPDPRQDWRRGWDWSPANPRNFHQYW